MLLLQNHRLYKAVINVYKHSVELVNIMFFNYKVLLYISVFVCVAYSESHDTCSSKHDSCGNSETSEENSVLSQIQHEYNLILSKINTAVSSYNMNCTSCDCFINTLNKDLKPFEKGITKEMVDRVRSKGTTYVIYDNKLFREKDCLFPARCSGIEHFLLPLIKKIENMEVIINTRDWPQINKHFHLFGPVFSFSKTPDYLDIMYPAWSFWEGGPAISIYPTGLGRWDLHRKSLLDEGKKWPWGKKKPIGFFRGSRTSDKRDNLVLLSRKRPDLVDAQYTKNQAWKSSADTLGAEPASIVSLEHHCQYKYLFNFRGVAASFRFKHLFLCGSLVIHVGNEWIEFFYPALKPWVHYIPLSDDFTEHDVVKILDFLHNHDDIAQEIALRGQKFVTDHLDMKEVKCYWRRLLKKYRKLVKYSVELDKNLIQIK